MSLKISQRPRRLRKSPATLSLLEETQLSSNDLILPIFVHDGKKLEEIDSMPGVFRWPLHRLLDQIPIWYESGIKAFALFPKISSFLKDANGSAILDSESIIYEAARKINQLGLDLILIADLALDPYTSHGHDGILNHSGNVDNDLTVEMLAKASLVCAESGFHWVAPSDMMDGRVMFIRKALDQGSYIDTSILAYSAKFCSAYYGPFRSAIGTCITEKPIDKGGYQLNPANSREAMRELFIDEIEGADILMVKPAEPYLDIIQQAKQSLNTPIAAYQVSGEYSRICAAGKLGWLDENKCALESLIAIKRAGADLILSYFADRLGSLLGGR